MGEFIAGFRKLHFVGPCVTVFGSARFGEQQSYYRLAREVGSRLAGGALTVMTGGGPGIMEAANRGAEEAGGRLWMKTIQPANSRVAFVGGDQHQFETAFVNWPPERDAEDDEISGAWRVEVRHPDDGDSLCFAHLLLPCSIEDDLTPSYQSLENGIQIGRQRVTFHPGDENPIRIEES